MLVILVDEGQSNLIQSGVVGLDVTARINLESGELQADDSLKDQALNQRQNVGYRQVLRSSAGLELRKEVHVLLISRPGADFICKVKADLLKIGVDACQILLDYLNVNVNFGVLHRLKFVFLWEPALKIALDIVLNPLDVLLDAQVVGAVFQMAAH